MKKQIISVFACVMVVVSAFPFVGTITEIADKNDSCERSQTTLTSPIEDSLVCSEPIISSYGDYSSITLEEATTYTNNPGKPVLPVITKTYVFPIGTIVSEVSCNSAEIHDVRVEKEIKYATHQVVGISDCALIETEKDMAVYGNSCFFPATWCEYHSGVGLDGNKHVTYLTVKFYPVRYSPRQHLIQYVQHADIQIHQQPPMQPVAFNDVYDLLIIAPQSFESKLKRLVEHKENMGIKTNLVITEDIYQAEEGRDEQEQIKYFIKHAIEEWGITYVLLVGGMKGQRFWNWYIPARISHVQPIVYPDDGVRPPFISDLYYADIYKYDDEAGYTFDDWDADGDGIFSEWTSETNRDVMDLYPDVYLGRLPCRYVQDVDTVVDRIITYETTAYGQEWFRRMAVAGGDTFVDANWGCPTDFDEGKIVTDLVISYMPSFEHTRIWTDGDGDVELTPENAIDVLNQGQGFFFYSGHGFVTSFGTHPHGDESVWIGLDNSDIKNLDNGDKLPIYVLDCCLTCQFNVSVFSFLKFLTRGYDPKIWMEIAPSSFGWLSVHLSSGGAIATLGCTTYGWSWGCDYNEDGICDIVDYYDPWLHCQYFNVYNQSVDILGQVFGQSITDYLHQFPLNWNSWYRVPSPWDCATVQYNVLLGDPSLKIGGYPQ